jgi:hypothetical protein
VRGGGGSERGKGEGLQYRWERSGGSVVRRRRGLRGRETTALLNPCSPPCSRTMCLPASPHSHPEPLSHLTPPPTHRSTPPLIHLTH